MTARNNYYIEGEDDDYEDDYDEYNYEEEEEPNILSSSLKRQFIVGAHDEQQSAPTSVTAPATGPLADLQRRIEADNQIFQADAAATAVPTTLSADPSARRPVAPSTSSNNSAVARDMLDAVVGSMTRLEASGGPKTSSNVTRPRSKMTGGNGDALAKLAAKRLTQPNKPPAKSSSDKLLLLAKAKQPAPVPVAEQLPNLSVTTKDVIEIETMVDLKPRLIHPPLMRFNNVSMKRMMLADVLPLGVLFSTKRRKCLANHQNQNNSVAKTANTTAAAAPRPGSGSSNSKKPSTAAAPPLLQQQTSVDVDASGATPLSPSSLNLSKAQSHLQKRLGFISRPSIEKLKQTPGGTPFGSSATLVAYGGESVPPVAGNASATNLAAMVDVNALIALYKERQEARKPTVSLVTIGHVDAGKSTLMGHLLQQLGHVDRRTIHRNETESRKMGKASFSYAWVLDDTEEERKRGVTVHCGHVTFSTDRRMVRLADAPGHRDLIANAIGGGLSQAECALLVVNATKGEFETGFAPSGQTREHALLARSFGLSQVIVAVNKMDTVEWERERFDVVCSAMRRFLIKELGFNEADVQFVPLSGLLGTNLSKKPEETCALTRWWNEDLIDSYSSAGRTLAECIDTLRHDEAAVIEMIQQPLRASVTDQTAADTVHCTILSGAIQSGDRVLILPSNYLTTVKNVVLDIKSDGTDAEDESGIEELIAFPGDSAAIQLISCEIDAVAAGQSLLSTPYQPPEVARRFQAKVINFQTAALTLATQLTLYVQASEQPAQITKLLCELNKSTNAVLKRSPKALAKGACGVVEFEVPPPGVILAVYAKFRPLGRIIVRINGETAAVGTVMRVCVDANANRQTEATSSAPVFSIG